MKKTTNPPPNAPGFDHAQRNRPKAKPVAKYAIPGVCYLYRLRAHKSEKPVIIGRALVRSHAGGLKGNRAQRQRLASAFHAMNSAQSRFVQGWL